MKSTTKDKTIFNQAKQLSLAIKQINYMKKLELNPQEFENVKLLLFKEKKEDLIKPKYFKGIVIMLLPLELALSLGF